MSARPTPFPAPLEAIVELFNQEAFRASHEVLEGSWRETDSDFYHGLILYTSAFVHVRRGNRSSLTGEHPDAPAEGWNERELADVGAPLQATEQAD